MALLLAFAVSELLIREVYISYTPRVRPDLASHLKERAIALTKRSTYLALIGKEQRPEPLRLSPQEKKELENKPYSPTFIKGIYAKETANASMVEIKHSEVHWVPISYTKKDGSVITLYIPEGTQPPEAGLF